MVNEEDVDPNVPIVSHYLYGKKFELQSMLCVIFIRSLITNKDRFYSEIGQHILS